MQIYRMKKKIVRGPRKQNNRAFLLFALTARSYVFCLCGCAAVRARGSRRYLSCRFMQFMQVAGCRRVKRPGGGAYQSDV